MEDLILVKKFMIDVTLWPINVLLSADVKPFSSSGLKSQLSCPTNRAGSMWDHPMERPFNLSRAEPSKAELNP